MYSPKWLFGILEEARKQEQSLPDWMKLQPPTGKIEALEIVKICRALVNLTTESHINPFPEYEIALV